MGEYSPQNATEEKFYQALYGIANAGGGEFSGAKAVRFFKKAGVDVGILKQVWNLSTDNHTMNIQQFFVALRYITLVQNGALPISKEKLMATSKVDLGLPMFHDIDTPASMPPSAPYTPSAPSAELNAKYAILPLDHMKYHKFFLYYDSEFSGFVEKDVAMDIFRLSGIDPNLLPAVYAMADDDRDGRLTSKEFCVAFHLIICIMKKGLPVPSSLPAPLKNFLRLAPSIPTPAHRHTSSGVSVAMQSALQEKQHLQERIRAENEAIRAHSAVLKLTTDEVIAIREQRCSFESELAVLNEQLQVMRDVLLSRTTERQLRQAYQERTVEMVSAIKQQRDYYLHKNDLHEMRQEMLFIRGEMEQLITVAEQLRRSLPAPAPPHHSDYNNNHNNNYNGHNNNHSHNYYGSMSSMHSSSVGSFEQNKDDDVAGTGLGYGKGSGGRDDDEGDESALDPVLPSTWQELLYTV